MADKHWTLIMQSNAKVAVDSEQLISMFTDMESMLALFELVATKRPATMRFIEDDPERPVQEVKLIMTEQVTPDSTFARPLGR